MSDKQLRALSDLRVWDRNYNEGDIGAISTSIAMFGFNRSIAVWRDGIVIAGNHTLLALQWLYKQQADVPQNVQVIDGEWWIQVSDASHLSDEEATAYAIADNRTAALANPDMEQLATLLQEVANFDDDLLAATSYTGDDLDDMLRDLVAASTPDEEGDTIHPTLADRFVVPPFSVLDARQGYWQDRKRQWLAIGIQSELGRGSLNLTMSHPYTTENKDFYTQKPKLEKELGKQLTSAEAVIILRERGIALKSQREVNASIMKNGKSPARTYGQDLMRGEHIVDRTKAIQTQSWIASVKGEDFTGLSANQSGTSIFDPVLCELAYRWFTPVDAHILDPFAGGSVRGIVASKLGRNYTGVELRGEQVEANIKQGIDLLDVGVTEFVKVKVSAKMARLKFNGCDPDYIRDVCHASCCQSSVAPNGTMITIHPSEIGTIEARGEHVVEGLLQPRENEKRCPFKTDEHLCGLHFTPDKPFGCIASPFTLNSKNTLIVRNRYKMLKCFNDGNKIPAYEAFRASLDLLFGDDEAERICAHFDEGGGDIIASMPYRNHAMLIDNDNIKHHRDGVTSQPSPTWLQGDSVHIQDIAPGEYDFIFTCPPYADLEIYSEDPADISNMDYDDFLEAYRAIIAASCAMLKDNRFACVVVGEVRGKGGNYYNFVGDTVRAFLDCGLSLYNEAILVTAVGSLPIRAGRQFAAGRKLGKTHQNVLIFLKGNSKVAVEYCGDVDVTLPDDMETLAQAYEVAGDS